MSSVNPGVRRKICARALAKQSVPVFTKPTSLTAAPWLG